MCKDLYKRYGYCIIPKGTLLYRTYKRRDYNDCMFFTIKSTLFFGSADEGKMQIWKTKQQIKVLFLIDSISHYAHAHTNITKLFKELYPNHIPKDLERFDLKIKNDNREIRQQFIEKLFHDFHISGWFTSIEDNAELEVCLFDKDANINQLELIQCGNINLDKYKGNSLKKIMIYPPDTFYENTAHYLQNIGLERFERYRKNINAEFDKPINKRDREYKRIDTFDLRFKLRI